MRAIEPGPNLLLIGGPKSGTTSLLLWLRKHEEIYHPWQRLGSGAWESGFLLGGIVDYPYEPSKPKGTLILPHEADMDYYQNESLIIDKSPQHLYSKKALITVRDFMPEAKVVITIRDPVDLFISLYHQMEKTVYFSTPFDELVEMLDDQEWIADADIPETWSFLTYPRFSAHVKAWVNELGDNRVRVVPLGAIAENPRSVLKQLSGWLNIDEDKMPRDLSVKNPRGKLSNSPIRRFLREPPNWAFAAARVFLPFRSLRKLFLDPIRSKGWKYVPSEKQPIPDSVREKIASMFSEDVEFFQSPESFIPESVIVRVNSE